MTNIDKYIKTEPNKTLTRIINKVRKEKAHPEIYGKHGSSRWVTETEFWGRQGISKIKAELIRRKKAGLISKHAGMPKSKRNSGFAKNNWLARETNIGGL